MKRETEGQNAQFIGGFYCLKISADVLAHWHLLLQSNTIVAL